MSAHINRGTTSPEGVTVFQDHADPSQFHYLPSKVECILGETLEDFKVTYWGMAKPYYVKDGTGRIRSLIGAILAGRARLEISNFQREKLIEQIKKEFPGITTPKLLPLKLGEPRIEPVFAENTLLLGENSDIKFPDNIQFGTSFNYLIGTGNSLFANFVAAQDNSGTIKPNPSFGINLYGKAEFRGEDWSARITCDLSQVWSYVRKKVSGRVGYGWFSLGANYDSIIQDLHRDKVININFNQGSMDLEKYGAQIFEMGKRIFEEINKQASAGDGYFKFEPNLLAPTAFSSSFLRFKSPWSVSVNGSYTEQRFTQRITFDETITFGGNFRMEIPCSMTLAVNCSSATADRFQELQVSERCVTEEKVKNLSERLAKERKVKAEKISALNERWISGAIDEAQYLRAIEIINSTEFTEKVSVVSSESISSIYKKTLDPENINTAFEVNDVIVVGMDKEEIDKYVFELLESKVEGTLFN